MWAPLSFKSEERTDALTNFSVQQRATIMQYARPIDDDIAFCIQEAMMMTTSRPVEYRAPEFMRRMQFARLLPIEFDISGKTDSN